MGKETEIDWCDSTWNPITGCLHGCDYCYAKKQAQRFGGATYYSINEQGKIIESKLIPPDCTTHVLDEPIMKDLMCPDGSTKRAKAPYPYYFEPTFHRYRLNIPAKWKDPRNIFVCSMADLMGAWVPDPWKQDVIAACKAAPQHRYLFLTKNPYGYDIWPTKDRPVEHEFDQDNFWLGCSMTGLEDLSRYDGHYGRYLYAMGGNMIPGKAHRFVSVEPILTDVMELPGYHSRYTALQEEITSRYAGCIEWVIIGAETGNRKGKVVPDRKWIEKIVNCCDKAGKPVFMKESLRALMGNDFRQEFPWGKPDQTLAPADANAAAYADNPTV